jgi:hypothetical protein
MSHRGIDLKIALVEFVRAEYKKRLREVNVFTADPRVREDMPCVAVNRVYDSEDDEEFANVYHEELTPAGDGTVEILAGLFTQSCELRIWTENADVRDDMFIELKEILVLAKKFLGNKNLGRMSVKGGRDENDFKTYAPLFIYWGVLNFRALSPLDVFEAADTSASKIKEVDSVVKDNDGNVLVTAVSK